LPGLIFLFHTNLISSGKPSRTQQCLDRAALIHCAVPLCHLIKRKSQVGDGAVGLLGVLSAKQMGAERIIAMSRHQSRQKLAREFGATDIVTERGEEGMARIKEITNGIGADSVLECVGTPAVDDAGDT
jgi:D-arabinose 1-dehydrogenase-like Zn-dependent alcohol dehydrogenase